MNSDQSKSLNPLSSMSSNVASRYETSDWSDPDGVSTAYETTKLSLSQPQSLLNLIILNPFHLPIYFLLLYSFRSVISLHLLALFSCHLLCAVSRRRRSFFFFILPGDARSARQTQLCDLLLLFTSSLFHLSPKSFPLSTFSHPTSRCVPSGLSPTQPSPSQISKYTSLAATHAHPAPFFAALTNRQQSLAVTRVSYPQGFYSTLNISW